VSCSRDSDSRAPNAGSLSENVTDHLGIRDAENDREKNREAAELIHLFSRSARATFSRPPLKRVVHTSPPQTVLAVGRVLLDQCLETRIAT
jgi:hypothetical protein